MLAGINEDAVGVAVVLVVVVAETDLVLIATIVAE
jgi:hypothetical protein